MSTRSTIWIKNQDSFEGIYCHFDGYLDGVGKTLFEHYNREELVRKLISQGDASYIGETIEDSRFYHTWRNEDLHIFKCRSLLSGKSDFEEYNYLFDGEWFLLNKSANPYKKLADCL